MYTLLLVEDEAMELLALKYAISTNYGDTFRMIEAADGKIALTLCEKYHPEIMIVDINIPGITGLDLIEAVNQMEFDTLILITTAYDKSGYIRRALEMGVLHYLLKPIDIRELKSAIDRCMERLEERRSQQRQMNTLLHGMESVRSYAKEYLVRDILCKNAPEEVLKSVCGWPADGSLQICLLCWIPEKEPDYDLFYEICEKQFREYFSVLFSPFEGYAALLLQSNKKRETQALMLTVRIFSYYIISTVKHGKIIGTGFFDSYEKLSTEWEKRKQMIRTLTEPVTFPAVSLQVIGSSHKRILLRQKILQRLREHQLSSVISLLKKTVLSSGNYWAVVTLFLNVLRRFDNAIDLREPLALCFEDEEWKGISKWMEQYYRTCQETQTEDGTLKSHIDRAIALMKQNYNQDLTMTGIAEELGLSAAYFSNLFKQQTGKNFVTLLHEIRIEHAIGLINQGENDMEKIAKQCGYVSKKYFFEAFKRTTGQSVTQYRQGDKR